MIEINASLFIQILNFLLLMIALNFLLYRPIRSVIRERREKIAGFENDIDQLAEQVEDRLKEIETRLGEAKKEGFLRKDEIKEQGLEEEKKIVGGVSHEAEAYVERIKAQIIEEIGQARTALQAETEVFSRELAVKVLGRSLS